MTLNYNVTGVARKELVYTIQELIGDRAKYAGMPTQAFIIGPYTVSKTGELTWENGMDAEPLIEALCEKGFEAFTELPEDAEPQETDLLTVSLPGNLFTEMNIANLRKLVDSKATLIKKALGVDELPIFVSEDKISFPWLTGERSPEEAHAFAHLVSALGEAARNAKRITAKEKNTENEKYAFRCFLLRLGFIGDETCLKEACVTEFAITDQSTALMRLLHILEDEDCKLKCLCKVTRSERRFGEDNTETYDGILMEIP